MPKQIIDNRTRMRTPECKHPTYYPNEPRSISGWDDWAEEMANTHEQKQCPHCKLWAIWELKN